MLAWRDGIFSWLPLVILTVGLFIAHGTNNLLNDYTDFTRGVDKDNYFRTQYGVHPLVQGFWDKRTQIRWFVVSGVLAVGAGVYALVASGFDPVVIGLFAFGAVVLLLYTYPFKYWGLGELTIFLIWGPILIGGVYLTLARITGGDLGNIWNVVLAGVPYGLSVASINIGKHIDKHDDDKAKGVGTFPVRVGEAVARRVDQAAMRPHLRGHRLSGLRAAVLHAGHADRRPGLPQCAEGHQAAEPAAPRAAAGGLPRLAHLVLRGHLHAQSPFRRLADPRLAGGHAAPRHPAHRRVPVAALVVKAAPCPPGQPAQPARPARRSRFAQ